MPKVQDIVPAKYNPRKINKVQLEALGRSMREFGDLGGLVVNTKTGNVVGGHQRLKHLEPSWKITKTATEDKTGTVARGYINTPFGCLDYREVSWPEVKEKAANIAANAHGGDFDKETSVLEFARPKRSEEHPTMKPVELVAYCVANSSPRGGVVFDPFLGSGTTLVACEKLGRKCYGLELSPAFCDVIIARWEKASGEKAVKL